MTQETLQLPNLRYKPQDLKALRYTCKSLALYILSRSVAKDMGDLVMLRKIDDCVAEMRDKIWHLATLYHLGLFDVSACLDDVAHTQSKLVEPTERTLRNLLEMMSPFEPAEK